MVHNEVAGFVIAVVGAIYAVLLAFLTVIVWERFAEAEDRSQQETNAATDVLRFSQFVAPVAGARLRDDLGRYVDALITQEWPAMARGDSSEQARRLIVRVIGDVAELPVPNAQQSNVQNHLLDRVQAMADLRRSRLNANRSNVPSVLWFALIIGACTVIGFVYLFGLKNFTVHLLITAATATMIGLSFGLILTLDYPFRGDVSVSPEHWITLAERLKSER
ncbi:MAG: DUF4239 domain-containing protein [Candidatus Eremiobacteraeota bacterium]|nr:DUF4239 domain-containing protein [Candidatus Eremiobacteraeota bacterium]MBC5804480.1 DUF4239 domain-containing protein [Candidatus Eremiobacteraeota bacterium]MBC5821237.1 DUF4239 domain-containing protein [Candidatus Eremiobacteraeota bacterium]